MDKRAILEKLLDVFRDVFDDEELQVSEAATADDVEGWDSLMHVSLMVNVERAFGVKFTSAQVASLRSVGELVELVDHRLAEKRAEGRA